MEQLRDLTRRKEHLTLNPRERRIAMLYAAGMSAPTIALQIQGDSQDVLKVIKRPHVARFVTQMSADVVDQDLKPFVRNLENEIAAIAEEALDRQVGVMRKLDEVGDDALAKEDFKNGIRAKLGVLTSTQDILDRAGKRAPTRTIGAVAHLVAPEQLEKLGRILSDMRPKEPTE